MILDADLSQIEWRVAAFLSQDKTMLNEIHAGVDAHGFACTEWMGFPLTKENRTIAKIFNFRMIYGGSPYSFYLDPKMPNFSAKKWERIVTSFYEKYPQLKEKQDSWYEELCATGQIVSPSGRILKPRKKEKHGVFDYSRPDACNYPVQSFATADITPLAMSLIDDRLVKLGAYDKGNLFIAQVHDSVIFDTVDASWARGIGHVCVHTFRQLPAWIEKVFNIKDFNVPIDGEMAIGPNWGAVEELEPVQRHLDKLERMFPTP